MAELMLKDEQKCFLRRRHGQTIEFKGALIQLKQKIAGHADFRLLDPTKGSAQENKLASRAC